MRRASSPPPELPGYRYVRLLGTGGFSDVFLYEQALPKRNVAVKVLLTDGLGSSARDAFVAEANLMAQLSAHPYIVTIHHADVTGDERPYFVMEYCSGPSLGERYKREAFAVPDVLRIGVRLAGAVATAHAAGILHRDIKPANVLTNDYGWPALTDFGIASNVEEIPVHTVTITKELEAGSTSSEAQSVGLSVPWSPAEMFEDDPRPDVRSDVFSLAATLHTLLAGRTPFEIPGRSNGTLDLIGRIERGAITPIGRDDIPRSLVAVLQKGMALKPEHRFASAVEFGRALQRVELELGYTPTTIEVPRLEDAHEAPRADDGDETRVRPVATIEAQPAVPTVSPSSSRNEDETRVRAIPSIAPDPEVEDRTLLRRGPRAEPVHDTLARTPDPLHDTTEPIPGDAPAASEPAPPKSRRGLLLGIVAAAVVVLLAAVVGVSIALSGVPSADPEETPQSSEPADAIVGGAVPKPVDGVAVPGADGASIEFSWTNPDPQDGDRYRWALSAKPGAATPTDEPRAVVGPVEPGSLVCIQVVVLRQGKTGNPLEVCSQ